MLAVAWKGLGWFLGSVAVTLGFLLVPLQVAAERKKLDRTVSEITQAQRDIRALETEFETRANIAQLEKWNGDTLRLGAPVSIQFMPNEAALAQVDFTRPAAGEVQVQVQMASIVPSRGETITPAVLTSEAVAAVHNVNAVATKPVAANAVAMASATPRLSNAVAEVRTAPVKRSRPQTVAMLDRQLLSDSMLGDLASAASREQRLR
ncbi:hypothetical protein [Sphingomonas alpina]|uniref:Uncharacterized protein n=1 Tax=Sphingomonas alpina TaxID=653931 RepID=A0A7H0LLG4_9SPHN|nr:hypothetical protein [Sphingomonas alpina]QNQ10517.1 hypothetical protein H3Z74_04690 [Sphingomonas alpina]